MEEQPSRSRRYEDWVADLPKVKERRRAGARLAVEKAFDEGFFENNILSLRVTTQRNVESNTVEEILLALLKENGWPEVKELVCRKGEWSWRDPTFVFYLNARFN